MKREYLKDLWMLRFEKVLKMEKDASKGYLKLATELSELIGEKHKAVKHLKKLSKEEQEHAELAGELIKICSDTPV